MSTKIISKTQLLYYTLERQGLLGRKSYLIGDDDEENKLISTLCPLHSTQQNTPYLSLLGRIEGFDEEERWKSFKKKLLTKDINQRKFAKIRCMRGTLHVIPIKMMNIYSIVFCNSNRERLNILGVDVEDKNLIKYKKDIITTLESQRLPMKCVEIRNLIFNKMTKCVEKKNKKKKTKAKLNSNSKCPVRSKIPNSNRYVSSMSSCGIKFLLDHLILNNQNNLVYGVVETPDTVSWTSTNYNYAMLTDSSQNNDTNNNNNIENNQISNNNNKDEKKCESNITNNNNNNNNNNSDGDGGEVNDVPELSHKEALNKFVIHYFDLYGPASLKDLIWWYSCKNSDTTIKSAFENIINDTDILIEVKVDDITQKLYMLKDKLKEITTIDSNSPIKMCRFLPYEDALIKGYKETRYRFFNFSTDSNNEIRNNVMKRGEAMPSIWIDGAIIGRWIWNKKKKSITIINYNPELNLQTNDLFNTELENLKQFLKCVSVEYS
eukprot:TRINITY_DN945_c1_g2_i1.p1 TRINITY_DN945_c1_g2~~TRINITY_DN945_c1_g2_i1.p1  ORF type:complete len:492 (+),score=107.51 TRINITY_DN945_c1_g2_i1:72-1547(+)